MVLSFLYLDHFIPSTLYRAWRSRSWGYTCMLNSREWRDFRWCDRLKATTISLPVFLLRDRVSAPASWTWTSQWLFWPVDYSESHAVPGPNLAFMRTGSCHLGFLELWITMWNSSDSAGETMWKGPETTGRWAQLSSILLLMPPRHQACEGSLVGALDSQTKLITH